MIPGVFCGVISLLQSFGSSPWTLRCKEIVLRGWRRHLHVVPPCLPTSQSPTVGGGDGHNVYFHTTSHNHHPREICHPFQPGIPQD